MDWRAKVELFEQIRRVYEFGTIVGVAKKLKVHRRMERESGSKVIRSVVSHSPPSGSVCKGAQFISQNAFAALTLKSGLN